VIDAVIQVGVQGFEWPSVLGHYSLMGPVNRLGSWRWYERKFDGMTQRVKVNHLLEPIDLRGFCDDSF
jgi:hypothetical protein